MALSSAAFPFYHEKNVILYFQNPLLAGGARVEATWWEERSESTMGGAEPPRQDKKLSILRFICAAFALIGSFRGESLIHVYYLCMCI